MAIQFFLNARYSLALVSLHNSNMLEVKIQTGSEISSNYGIS